MTKEIIGFCFILFYLIGCANTKQSQIEIINDEAFDRTDTVNIVGADSVNWSVTGMKLPQAINKPTPSPNTEFVSSYSNASAIVKLLVTSDGNVSRAIIIKTDNKEFNKYALEAAMKWKFKPAFNNGVPFNAWLYIPFKYQRH